MTPTDGPQGHANVRKRAGREATDWMILLQDDPEDCDLRSDFQEWLAASPVNREAWEQTNEIMGFVDQVQPIHVGHRQAPSDTVAPERVRPVRRAPGLFRKAAHPAVALAACAILWFAGPVMLLHWRADNIAGTGQIERVALADGSLVTLSAGSAIATNVGGAVRDVRLLRGSAVFEVAHDAARPFHVNAQGIRTTVLGTRFEVALQGEGGTVGVMEGRVRVEYPGGSPAVREELHKGDRIRLGKGEAAIRQSGNPDGIAAWRDGQLILSDRPAREVIDALRPWYGGMIVARGYGLDSRRLTGVYDIRDPSAAFVALSRVPGVRVDRITPWIVIVSVS